MTIVIELGNEKMQSRWDVFEAIRRSIVRPTEGSGLLGPLMAGEKAPLVDESGDTVGHWAVTL